MHATMGRRRYEVVRCKLPRSTWAECDAPDKPGKQIRLSSRLRGRELVECVIHECLHAQGWHLDEEFVERAGREIANLLDRMGLIAEEPK